MAANPLPPVEFLRECFRYYPKSGRFVWLERPARHFSKLHICMTWNAKMAGKRAFITPGADGYVRAEVVFEGRRMRLNAGRVALKLMTGEEPEMVDHRDRNTKNNRFANLRASNRYLNQANTAAKRGKALPKGVFSEGRRFVTSVAVAGNRKRRLGSFATPEEAKAVYDAHQSARYGEHFRA